MGLFSGKEDKPKVDSREGYGEQVSEFLLQGESIEEIYPLLFDFLCFTNKRLIFVDKDLSFKEPKTTIVTIPYNKINGIGLVKNEKVFAFTDELILNTKAKNYDLKFIKGTNIKEVYNKIVEKIL
ncbi:PH domain-containing protein [Clostridium sp.]|jgi:hypothetical protein|uniref:PH domain-containing protein n=1 Tax=Clostridium sp. TaxID=1506 RepID=UPI0039F5C68A